MKNNGFTLLEIIVTMVVVVVGLVMISQAFSTSLRAVSVSNNATLVKILADQQIAQIEMQTFSALQSSSGNFAPDHPEISWQEDVQNTSLNNLKQVTLTISWTERNAPQTLVIIKLIADHGNVGANTI